MKLRYITLDNALKGGNQRVELKEEIFDTKAYEDSWGSEAKLMLLQYKTMSQLIEENPDYFFDKHGNFCDNKGNTFAPSYFCYLGQTVHSHYVVNGIIPQDTWYYKVLDY